MKKLILLHIFVIVCAVQAYAQLFEVTYEADAGIEQFSGNVLLYLSKDHKSPKDIFVGLDVTPVYRLEVSNVKPNENIIFDDDAISFPVELSNIERGEYYVQAVFDLNLGDANIAKSAGNIFSEPIQVMLDKDFNKTFRIVANQVVPSIDMKESEFLKDLRVRSTLLSEFYGKDVFVSGAVSLPDTYYEKPEQTYPLIVSTFGFGANYKLHAGHSKHLQQLGDQPTIVVYLDGNCPEGHSTYANSDVNGPWGDALVTEFIPALEKTYRTNGARLLDGHSSGGWTSLWLQINYPEIFVGAWASAPDQVDFRNYQNKNIYETSNMFYDENGRLLADITIAGRFPVTSAKDLYSMENIVYRGSQLRSFDAVFGGYDAEGNRVRLVHLPSGDINKEALPLWKRYDLSIILRERWDELKDKINGKIRISIGTSDNFHLHHAVKLLEGEVKELGADMEFQYYPGDHFTIATPAYKQDGVRFLEKCYKRWLREHD